MRQRDTYAMPGPLTNPQVTLESDAPVAGTRNRVASIRVRGIGTDADTINKITTALMSLRYGGVVTTTPTESSGGEGFFVLHYQGEPVTQGQVAEAVRSQAMWKVTRRILGR
jgi:hypothetical protein